MVANKETTSAFGQVKNTADKMAAQGRDFSVGTCEASAAHVQKVKKKAVDSFESTQKRVMFVLNKQTNAGIKRADETADYLRMLAEDKIQILFSKKLISKEELDLLLGEAAEKATAEEAERNKNKE